MQGTRPENPEPQSSDPVPEGDAAARRTGASGAGAGALPPPEQRVEEEVDADLLNPPEHDLSRLLEYEEIAVGMADSTNCGLRNLTNTCYANVVLQSVAKLPSYR